MFEAIEEVWTSTSNLNEYTRALVTLSTSVGAIVIIFYTLKIVYKLFIAFRLYCLSQYQCFSRTDYKKKYGQWAVISGSTDGIGLAMAADLARRGMSIVVIGRNEEKLARTKASLENEPNAGEIMTVRIDLSDSSIENFERIRTQIDPENRDIGILINNAGTFPSKARRFNRYTMEDIKEIVNLNVLATLYLTRMIMPGMLVRGRGAVVNVSSTLGVVPAPFINVYGATKAFMNTFSRQLQIEYSEHPVDIVNLTPGGVQTKLFKEFSTVTLQSPFTPSPEDYARTALNALSTGISNYCGTAAHGLGKEISLISESLGMWVCLLKFNYRLAVRNLQLSPVMKRKAAPTVTDSGGETAGQESTQLAT